MDDRERLARVEAVVEKHDEQFARMDHRFDGIDHRFDRLEDSLASLRTKMHSEFVKITGWQIGMTVAILGIVVKLVLVPQKKKSPRARALEMTHQTCLRLVWSSCCLFFFLQQIN